MIDEMGWSLDQISPRDPKREKGVSIESLIRGSQVRLWLSSCPRFMYMNLTNQTFPPPPHPGLQFVAAAMRSCEKVVSQRVHHQQCSRIAKRRICPTCFSLFPLLWTNGDEYPHYTRERYFNLRYALVTLPLVAIATTATVQLQSSHIGLSATGLCGDRMEPNC